MGENLFASSNVNMFETGNRKISSVGNAVTVKCSRLADLVCVLYAFCVSRSRNREYHKFSSFRQILSKGEYMRIAHCGNVTRACVAISVILFVVLIHWFWRLFRNLQQLLCVFVYDSKNIDRLWNEVLHFWSHWSF